MNWKLRTKGYLHWGYNFWPRDPYAQVLMGRPAPGDCFVVYPGRRGILDSIRFEAMRDGIEDYELVHMLAGIDRAVADAVCDRVIRSKTDYVRHPARFLSIRRKLLETLSAR